MKANDVISPVGLVATPDSIEEFQERLEALSGPEKTVATLYSTMAWNLAHKLLSEALEREKSAKAARDWPNHFSS